MNKLSKTIVVFSLLMAFGVAQAQEVSPVDFMKMNPYQMKSNPAADLPYTSVMSLIVGNVGLDFRNTGLKYNNLFDFDAQGRPTTLNLSKFANSLSENNALSFSANENLFTFYHRVGPGMLTVGYDVRVQGDLSFNDDLFDLLANGNAGFVGEDNPVNVNFGLNATAFQQLAVGYQIDVGRSLSIGGRAKLLFGFGNVATNAFDVKMVTDPSTYALRMYEDIAMKACLPSFFTISDGKLVTAGNLAFADLFSNPGFGVDLGAEYHITDDWGVVASVQDLGFISWGANNVQMTGQVNDVGPMYDDGSFLFDGIAIDQLQRIISDEYYRGLFLDTLKQYFQLEVTPTERYTTMLNTNILLRGYYDIDPENRISVQAQGCFKNGGFSPAFTLAYSGTFFEMLDVCATYTLMKGSYTNFGIGLAGNFNTFHIYLATNNIIGAFTPLNSKGFNAQAGIVFNLRSPDYSVGSRSPRYLRY
jgi:hypothetical protein